MEGWNDGRGEMAEGREGRIGRIGERKEGRRERRLMKESVRGENKIHIIILIATILPSFPPSFLQ